MGNNELEIIPVVTFSPKGILGFLGRKWDRRFDGEVYTHYEEDRWFGSRIKHRMKTNWLKMYDKFGLILRVETVISAADQQLEALFEVVKK